MSVSIDLQQTRELQESQCEPLSGPELAAFFRGFPPGSTCPANPAAFAKALRNGEIAPNDTPVGMARQNLETKFGPQEAVPLTASWKNAGPNNTIDPTNTPFPFDLGMEP